MARRDRPAEQGQDPEMPRTDRDMDVEDEGLGGEGGRDIRGVADDEEEEDEFEEDEAEDFEEDEEEGIR